MGAIGFRPDIAARRRSAGRRRTCSPGSGCCCWSSWSGAVRRLIRGESSDAGAVPALPGGRAAGGVHWRSRCIRPVLPHWTLVGFSRRFPLLGRLWADRAEASPARMRRGWPSRWRPCRVAIAVLIVAQYRLGIFQQGAARPARADARPRSTRRSTCTAGTRSADELKRRGLLDRPGTFLFTEHLVSQRPARLRDPGQRRAGALLQPRGRPELRLLEPARGLGRPRRHPRRVERPTIEPRCYRAVLRADRAGRRVRSSGPGVRSGRSGSSAASASSRRSRSTDEHAPPATARRRRQVAAAAGRTVGAALPAAVR